MIKVIIFDADGMALEQERPSVFLSRDYGISTDQLNTFFDGPFQECLIGKADLKEAISPYLSKWGWNKGIEAFLKLWFTREVYVNKEILKYIKYFKNKGIQCFLATNQEKYRFQYMLNELNLKDIFDKTYSSTNLGCKKPSYDFFKKLLKDLKDIKKEEILFWDDRPKNIEEARTFGFNAELFTSVKDFREKMIQYKI